MSHSKPALPEASKANQRHWDSDAVNYHARHADYLQSFYWCPEMLHEKDLQLLGDVSDKTILELGCGSAPCSRWLAERFPTATVVGLDLSREMLRHATTGTTTKEATSSLGPLTSYSPPNLHLIQADATTLPFSSNSFDIVFSAFGAIPFIENLHQLFSDIARILTTNGQFVYAINHPMRWVFPDEPGTAGLVAAISYFETAYVETTGDEITYAEFQHTFGDHVRALHAAGFLLTDVLEPPWPPNLQQTWGQWSPLRGKIFPGTAIFIAELATTPS